MNILKQISIGYYKTIKNNLGTLLLPFKVVIFLGLIVGVSFGIVYPLWLFATLDKELYSTFVIITILALTVIFIIYKAVRYIYYFGILRLLKEVILPVVIKVVKFSLVVSYIGTTAYFFKSKIILGVIMTLLGILAIGIIKFVYKKN